MKIMQLGFIILLIAGILFGEATNAFEIISYSPDTGIVTINNNARETNRPFSSFTTAEQQQITDWLTDREFKASGIRVEIEQKKTTKKDAEEKDAGSGGPTLCGKTDQVSYVITLENQTSVPFKDIQISYVIFYQTEDESGKSKRSVVGGTRINLQPGEIQFVETRDVDIRDEKIVQPGFSSPGFSFSTPGGTKNVPGHSGGWAPTKFIKDRLNGLYLCVSKRDRNGQVMELEFEDGNPPEKEKQGAYRVFGRGSATSTVKRGAVNSITNKTKVESSIATNAPKKPTGEWSEEEIEMRTKTAERNSIGAVFLAEYYSRQGDAQKAKQWADKAREMLAKLPPEQREATEKRIAALDQKPGETQPSDRATSGVVKKKQSAGPSVEVKILSEEAVAKYTQQAERGSSGAAYRLCRHYSALKDREKTVQWADKARALLAEKPPENPHALTNLLAILNQLEKEAGER